MNFLIIIGEFDTYFHCHLSYCSCSLSGHLQNRDPNNVVAGSLHVVLGTVVDVHTNYQELLSLLSLLVDLCVRVAILANFPTYPSSSCCCYSILASREEPCTDSRARLRQGKMLKWAAFVAVCDLTWESDPNSQLNSEPKQNRLCDGDCSLARS